MRIKKVLTANLKPGMVVAEGAYTSNNHLVIQSNSKLTQEIIDKLKNYSVKSVKVFIPEIEDIKPETKPASVTSTKTSTYYERIEQSQEFKQFETAFTSCVDNLKHTLNDIVIKNSTEQVDNLLINVEHMINKTRNPLHLLDLMQCMHGYDDMTFTHSMNVSLICNVIGSWLHLPEDEMDLLMTCGLLHDIGKLKIPAKIIQKPGRLTDDEFKQVKMHPEFGYEILKEKNLDSHVALAALQHHERFNGSGYPYGIAGKDIDKISSIVAIADVYDAMTSDRVYRKGLCPFPVIEQMEREKNQYNPNVLLTFIKRTAEAYVNTEVRLSNGEQGRVVLINQNFLSRPIVIAGTKSYDLSKMTDIEITELI